MVSLSKKPKPNSRWIARNGNHKHMEIIVQKVGETTVVVMPITGNKKNRISGKPLTWRLPIDAFYRRYVSV